MGQIEALAGIGKVRRTRRAFVESHHDIRTNAALDIHDALRGEEMLRPIDVGTEFASFFRKLAYTRQREDLEPTAIGEHRAVKTVEFM